jgi:hypothetical protein
MTPHHRCGIPLAANLLASLLASLVLFGLLGCNPPAKPAATPAAPNESEPEEKTASNLLPVAGIQDIMRTMLEPSADALWLSVGSTVTAAGEEDFAPSTNEEWEQLHTHALALVEATNLLLMDDRRVVREGVDELEDHGTPGNLTAEEVEAAIAANRVLFVDFAMAMRSTGQKFLTAIADKNTQGMFDAGHSLELICEGCHLEFWYPGQVIPPFPGGAAEEPAPAEPGSSS